LIRSIGFSICTQDNPGLFWAIKEDFLTKEIEETYPFIGGKSPLDNEKWAPNLEAVRASIRFAIATGRLEAT
jgi:hypothetical protein